MENIKSVNNIVDKIILITLDQQAGELRNSKMLSTKAFKNLAPSQCKANSNCLFPNIPCFTKKSISNLKVSFK
ncbi:MAG: hypothetical protein OWP43_00065 [Sphaerochaetaceae bacterium]|nr:hypothetical protein [Sphaerochaetaceae bacterium]